MLLFLICKCLIRKNSATLACHISLSRQELWKTRSSLHLRAVVWYSRSLLNVILCVVDIARKNIRFGFGDLRRKILLLINYFSLYKFSVNQRCRFPHVFFWLNSDLAFFSYISCFNLQLSKSILHLSCRLLTQVVWYLTHLIFSWNLLVRLLIKMIKSQQIFLLHIPNHFLLDLIHVFIFACRSQNVHSFKI